MEPVSLARLKAHCRVTSDLEDELLTELGIAARQLAEAYTKRYFVSQFAEKTYRIDQAPVEPLADIVSVRGYITDLADLPTSEYNWVQYVKGITVSRDLPVDPYSPPKYTISYHVTVDPADVPQAVQTAILLIAATLYENRENTHVAPVGSAARQLLAKYRLG